NVAIAARPVRPRPNRRESFKTPFRHRIPAMDSGGGKITLDQESFKALASDVRVGILKRLDVRRETITDLSGLLNLSTPTSPAPPRAARSGPVARRLIAFVWSATSLVAALGLQFFGQRRRERFFAELGVA